ncbi:MAG: TIGR04283 family arsenosugar biosynthesis glycosyltransferase [Rhodothermales bacterium]
MTVSVIIPALNEAQQIAATLDALEAAGLWHEIIVVDGGSNDATMVRAQRPTTQVISGPRGRAHQMNTGAHHASGEVLFFLHADTRVPPTAFEAIQATFAEQPEAGAGTFRLTFDARSPLLNLYSTCTRFPSPRLTFGDRGLFIRRAVFDTVGGFPDQPVFEDVEMVRRIRAMAPLIYRREAVVTSARRFLGTGPLRQQLRNAMLWGGYFAGVAPERLAAWYPYRKPSV